MKKRDISNCNIREIKLGLIDLCYEKSEVSQIYFKSESSSKLGENKSKMLTINNQQYLITATDIFNSNDYYSNFSEFEGIIFFFDISNPKSIAKIEPLLHHAKNCLEKALGPIYVVSGTKSELRQEKKPNLVPVKKYREIEKEFKCNVYEISTKTGQNIETLFKFTINKILRKRDQIINKEKVEICFFGSTGSYKDYLVDLFKFGEKNFIQKRKEIEDEKSEFDRIIEIKSRFIPVKIIDTPSKYDVEFEDEEFPVADGYVFVFNASYERSLVTLRRIYNLYKTKVKFDVISIIAATNVEINRKNDDDVIEVFPHEKYGELEAHFKCKLFEVNINDDEDVEQLVIFLVSEIFKYNKNFLKNTEKNREKKAKTK